MVALPTHALSLLQPWAYFMLSLPPEHLKRIENRKPGFSHKSFRGECWVHASKMTRSGFYQACSFALDQGVPRELLPTFTACRVGGIIGRWRIVDMLPPPDPEQLPDRWRMDGQIGFVVEDARPVPFVACKGALGFWRVPADVLEQLGKAAA